MRNQKGWLMMETFQVGACVGLLFVLRLKLVVIYHESERGQLRVLHRGIFNASKNKTFSGEILVTLRAKNEYVLQVGAATRSLSKRKPVAVSSFSTRWKKNSRSHGISASPLTSSVVMSLNVLFVDVRNLGHKRIIRVWVRQQGTDGEEHLRDRKCGWPLVLQDVQANRAITVDVHVVHFRRECNLGRLERVIGREMDIQEEHSLVVRRVLWAHDSCLPMELIIRVGGASRAVCRWVSTKVDKFLLDSFSCHTIFL